MKTDQLTLIWPSKAYQFRRAFSVYQDKCAEGRNIAFLYDHLEERYVVLGKSTTELTQRNYTHYELITKNY